MIDTLGTMAGYFEADPELMHRGATRLAELADRLAGAAARVRIAAATAPPGVAAGDAARCDELAAGLGAAAVELELLSARVRARALVTAQHEASLVCLATVLDAALPALPTELLADPGPVPSGF